MVTIAPVALQHGPVVSGPPRVYKRTHSAGSELRFDQEGAPWRIPPWIGRRVPRAV